MYHEFIAAFLALLLKLGLLASLPWPSHVAMGKPLSLYCDFLGYIKVKKPRKFSQWGLNNTK